METFYPLYLHLKRPSVQTPIADLHLFSHPIKPVWEDPSNVKGGKWTIRLRKGLSDRLWESLVLSLIGGGLEKLVGSGDGQEICGAVLSVRRDEDIMAVWHRSGDADLAGDGKMAKKVKLSSITSIAFLWIVSCSRSYCTSFYQSLTSFPFIVLSCLGNLMLPTQKMNKGYHFRLSYSYRSTVV